MQRILCALAFVLTFADAALAQQATHPGYDAIWDRTNPARPRHWFTGLQCGVPLDNLTQSVAGADSPFGNDVNCRWGSPYEDVYVTLHMLLRQPGVTSEQHQDIARQAISLLFPQARRRSAQTVMAPTNGGSLHAYETVYQLSGVNAVTGDPAVGASGLWIADLSGWDVKIRVTVRNGDEARARQLAFAALRHAAETAAGARACAAQPPALHPPATPSEQSPEEVSAARTAEGSIVAISLLATNVLPADTPTARLAGYSCLEVIQDYPARVVRRRPDISPTPELMQLGIDPLYRGEPLGAGPSVWFVIAPERLGEAPPGPGQVMHTLAYENGGFSLFGTTDDRANLPGLTAAIAQGAIPTLVSASIGQGESPPP